MLVIVNLLYNNYLNISKVDCLFCCLKFKNAIIFKEPNDASDLNLQSTMLWRCCHNVLQIEKLPVNLPIKE